MRGVAPYARIISAADLRFADGSLVSSRAAYLGWHREKLAENGQMALEWAYDDVVPARVNHGRWITDCPNRQSGTFTHPEWQIAVCGECGCVMRHVVFPADPPTIARLLLARPRRDTQNWFPTESVADLQRENDAHAVGG